MFVSLLTVLMIDATTLPFPAQPDIYLEVIATPDYRGKVFFFAPHENENVVEAYLKQKILNSKGRFAILRQNGERHVRLAIDGHGLEIDPNRIFTSRGAKATLLSLNSELEEGSELFRKAWARTVQLGSFIIANLSAGPLKRGSVIVAVHNNTDGYDDDGSNGVGTVSIERYRKRLLDGASYIKAIHEGTGDEDDLFFINRRRDFRKLRRAGWHVVLQHPRVARLPEEDDGSLSVWAEIRKLRYINIEAQRKHDDGQGEDHLETQMRMVDFLLDSLARPMNRK